MKQTQRVTDLYKQIETLNDENKKAFDAEDDQRAKDPAFNMTAAERTAVKDRNKKIEELEHQVQDAEEADGLRAATSERARKSREPQDSLEQPSGGRDDKGDAPVDLGRKFSEDPLFKAWLKQVAPNGQISDSMKGISSPPIQMKTLITSTVVSSLITPDRKPFVALPFRPITILDVITGGTTDSDTVEFAREATRTNAAAFIAQATTDTGTSGTKPQSALTLEKVTAAVRTLAHWIPATKRAIGDAGQIRTLVNAFLIEGLRDVVADQVINGDGTGENLLGILATPGITEQAFVTDRIVTARKARTAARVTGRAAPTAYVMNPVDWETIDLLKDNEARYYFGGPSVLGTPRLWGLPVIEEERMPLNEAVCAPFNLAVLWMREQASIQVSDSHSDFFVRNLVAILAEERAAFGLLRPAAFVHVNWTV